MLHSQIIERFYQSSLKASLEVSDFLETDRVEADFEANFKGEGGDMAIGIDLKAEAIFFDHFLPFASIYSEERGREGFGDYCVILDPIDGSDNLVTNFPYYGASMALQYKDKTIAALVCNLATGAYYYREEGLKAVKGSIFNAFTKEASLNPYGKVGIFEKSALYPKIIDKLIKNKLKFRSPGAVALSLVYAFEARYMIFLGPRRIFDLEAGLFIIADLALYEDQKSIIVAPNVEMLEIIKRIVLGE